MSHDPHGSPSSFDLEHVFSDQEWEAFKRDDRKAGAAVVSLMLAIFGVGVVLYSIVVITL